MFGLLQEPPARRSRSLTISNDQESIELPHHRNRYTPQPPTTARGTYPQNFNSPQAPHFSAADGIFRFRGEIYQQMCSLSISFLGLELRIVRTPIAEHRVEDAQQLPHARDHRDFEALAALP